MIEKKRQLNKPNYMLDIVLVLIIGFVLIMITLWVQDYIKSRMIDFDTIEQGSIGITLQGELLVMRHETLLNAPSAGAFVSAINEGERVNQGTVIGQSGDINLIADRGGIISFALDGWEQILQPDLLDQINLDQAFNQLAASYTPPIPAEAEPDSETAADDANAIDNAANQANDDSIANLNAPDPALIYGDNMPPNQAEGRPVARLIDNLMGYTLILKLNDPHNLLDEESRLDFTLDNGQHFYLSFDERRENDLGDSYFIFSISNQEDMLLNLRYAQAEIIARDIEGFIVPSEAVTINEQGIIGIYLRQKNRIEFWPVDELAAQDGYSVIKGIDNELEAGLNVVINPDPSMEGQEVF